MLLNFKEFIIEGRSSLKLASGDMHDAVEWDDHESRSFKTFRLNGPHTYEHIPISQLRVTQTKIDNQKIANLRQAYKKKNHDIPYPQVVHHNGEYGVQDGHHRVEAQIRNGATHIHTKVVHIVRRDEK